MYKYKVRHKTSELENTSPEFPALHARAWLVDADCGEKQTDDTMNREHETFFSQVKCFVSTYVSERAASERNIY